MFEACNNKADIGSRLKEFSDADLEADGGPRVKAPQQGTALKAPHARTRGGPLSRHGLWLFLAILKQTFTAAVALDDLL
jgi:hypothetical protein